ncbi:fringe glycosyltransferase, partial [Chrysoperla carnea]|uniref:fringe glycosyltransferase n=1 Tax=Chrysoperla carnea TaxID=189513 RepID=UPI001D088C1A
MPSVTDSTTKLIDTPKVLICVFCIIILISIIIYIQTEQLPNQNQQDNQKIGIKYLNEVPKKVPQKHFIIKNQTITLSDIFISVKTTDKFLSSRVNLLIKTWFQLVKDQTWFFTDADNDQYYELTSGHLVNTNCPQSHNRKSLCCKMSVELDSYIKSNKKWFCHFDDDNYVNAIQLLSTLQKYSPLNEWYLGKKSVPVPMELHKPKKQLRKAKKLYWFATGGAGFCMSKALVLKMATIISGGKFMTIGNKLRAPDDVTIGYIVENLLNIRLTEIEKFHSHLETLPSFTKEYIRKQISFSYDLNRDESNVLNIDGFDIENDPTRFMSLHCFLFP